MYIIYTQVMDLHAKVTLLHVHPAVGRLAAAPPPLFAASSPQPPSSSPLPAPPQPTTSQSATRGVGGISGSIWESMGIWMD